MGSPHQIRTGTPLDPNHTCSTSSTRLMVNNAMNVPNIRHQLTWSLGCRDTFRAGTAACSKKDCKLVSGHSLRQVKDLFLARVADMAADCEDWKQQDDGDFPESVRGVWLAKAFLAPHGKRLSGLLIGSWEPITQDNDEGLYNCVALILGPQPMDDEPCEDTTAQDEILLDTPSDTTMEVLHDTPSEAISEVL
jgi:hypothetical protein